MKNTQGEFVGDRLERGDDGQSERRAVDRVVIDACTPAGWAHDLCGELGLRCEVANTAGAAWAWKNVKRKTDRDDAFKLAWLSCLGELPRVTAPSAAVRIGCVSSISFPSAN